MPANALVRNGKTYATSGRVAMVSSLFSHLYREASVTKHAPVITIPIETKFKIVDETDSRWLRVRQRRIHPRGYQPAADHSD